MTARIIEIANDVVTVINGGTFTIPDVFTAERLFIPEFSIEDLKTLRVTVLLSQDPEELLHRRASQIDYTISVGVQKKCDNLTTDFDALVEFCDEINELFRFTKLPTTAVSWVSSERDPIYDPDMATQTNIFTSVINLTFRDFLKA